VPHELLWRPEFGPVILGRLPMPPEPVIQLPTGYVRLVEAMGLIQEHASIPIVMPEELASDERHPHHCATASRRGPEEHLDHRHPVLRPEAPDDALEAIGPDGALIIGGDEWVVTVGQVTVPLGLCHRVFFHPRMAEVHELEDGSRRVVLEPAGGGPGRAEERLGSVP
jgi:hypothetical protein